MLIDQYTKLLSELNLQGLFLYDCPNKVHLLGLTQPIEGDWAVAVSLKRRDPLTIFVRDSLISQEKWSKSPFKDYVRMFSNSRDLVRKARSHIRRTGIGAGLAWENELTINQLSEEGVEITDLSRHLLKLREIKTEEEQKTIKQASSITNQAFLNLINILQGSSNILREVEIVNIIQREMMKQGADRFAIPTSVVSELSPSPQQIWRLPTNKKIAKGALILLRFGAQVGYYKSVIHRVILTQAKSPEIGLSSNILEMVQAEHQNFLEKLKRERKIEELGKPSKKRYSELFKPGKWLNPFGYGIGLEVAEQPQLLAESVEKLNENTVISAGKGFVIKDSIIVPVRDMILIKKPIEVLTPSSPIFRL